MLSDVGAVDNDGNIVLLKLSLGADTREHKKLRRLEDSLRDDGLVLGVQRKLLSSGWVDSNDAGAHLGDRVDDKLLGVEAREDGDVGSVDHVQEAALADTVVD